MRDRSEAPRSLANVGRLLYLHTIYVAHGEHTPLAVDALEGVPPAILEAEPRTTDQLAGRAGEQDVTRSSQGHHPGCNHDGESSELPADLLGARLRR